LLSLLIPSSFSLFPTRRSSDLPLFKSVALPLAGISFVAIAYFWIVGFYNAVNLTDGLDGLAIMPTVLVAVALGVFAYASGHAVLDRKSTRLNSSHVKISYAVFC